MKVTPVQQRQQPLNESESNYSDQARRVTILAIGILGSALILAVVQPPASIILASALLITTLAIALDFNGPVVSEGTVYVVKERPSPHWHFWNRPSSFRNDPPPEFHQTTFPTSTRLRRVGGRDDSHVPVGTGETNPPPYQTPIPVRANPPPRFERADSHVPVGTGERNPPLRFESSRNDPPPGTLFPRSDQTPLPVRTNLHPLFGSGGSDHIPVGTGERNPPPPWNRRNPLPPGVATV